MTHPLLRADTVARVEAAVSAHLGRSWRVNSWVDLQHRSSHPAAVLAGDSLAVFAKLATGAAAHDHVDSELAGLRMINNLSGVAVPTPIGSGRVDLRGGSYLIMFEALTERLDRSIEDWRSIGRALARLHQVPGDRYGADARGFFGPLPQDNRPADSDSWADFYATRRVLPWLRTARDAGAVDAATAARVEALLVRLPELAGPDPGPWLLHGDAQHHNFVSTANGAVVIDPAPYFGHPELDLALLDYFAPVPTDTWAGYAEIRPIDAGFADRRELWRVFAYLGVLTVDSGSAFGRSFRSRLDTALRRYLG